MMRRFLHRKSSSAANRLKINACSGVWASNMHNPIRINWHWSLHLCSITHAMTTRSKVYRKDVHGGFFFRSVVMAFGI